jgi:hypothetical protein
MKPIQIACSLIIFWGYPSFAEETLNRIPAEAEVKKEFGWEKFDHHQGVDIYRKHVEGVTIPAFKAIGEIEAPIRKLVSLIYETKYHLQWMAKVKHSETVQEITPHEKLEYLVLGAPWPVKDRDAIVKIKLELKPAEKQVWMQVESVDDSHFPQQPGRVRAWMYFAHVILTELGPEKTRVEAQMLADPKGAIPSWIVALYSKYIPRVALKRIRANAQRPDIALFPLWENQNSKLSRQTAGSNPTKAN